MFKSKTFDNVSPARLKEKYKEEFMAVIDFNGSSHETMCLEYETGSECRRAWAAIGRFVRKERLPITASTRKGRFIVLARKSLDDKEG